MKIPVLLGTSRKGNFSKSVAQYLHGKLSNVSEIDSPWLDLGEINLPVMLDRLDHADVPPPGLADWNEVIKTSDALLIVVPEYKNGIPGALKNLLDYLPAQVFRYKPIAICTVSSGDFGGLNCLSQLRLVALACGGMPIPDKLLVSSVKELFSPDGLPTDPKFSGRSDTFLDELLKYARAFQALNT